MDDELDVDSAFGSHGGVSELKQSFLEVQSMSTMSAEECERALKRNARFSETRLVLLVLLSEVVFLVFMVVLFSGLTHGDGWSWHYAASKSDLSTYEPSCSCFDTNRVLSNISNAVC